MSTGADDLGTSARKWASAVTRSWWSRSAGLALAGGAGALGLRYLHDRAEAEARLARLERLAIPTPVGRLEYCEWGEGEPLLLVHGVVGGCDVPSSWRALVPAGYRIITPSRFGYLGSPLPEKPTTAAQAEAFVGLFDALGIEQAPVLAFSAGSTSAVQLALRHPERVSALVLVASNSPHEKPVTLAPRALAPFLFSQPALWILRVVLPSKLAAIAGTPSRYPLSEEDVRALESIFDSFFPVGPRAPGIIFDGYVGNTEIADCRFEEITVPTLGVHAVDDPLASYENAHAMVARIPNSRWVRVERGGHIFLHKDEQAKREIAAFLAVHALGLAGSSRLTSAGSRSGNPGTNAAVDQVHENGASDANAGRSASSMRCE
jgi:pimeloyl-ACP methyl ester carboxylesterase